MSYPDSGVNELAIRTSLGELADLRKRVEELERRARILGDDTGPESNCCTSYCCVEQPFESLEVGEIGDYCVVEPDPIGGEGIRLDVSGWIRLTAVDAGLVMMRVWVDVDAVEYVGSPQTFHTMAASDVWTIPYGNSIDAGTADPIVTVRVQNLNTPTIRVDQVYSVVWVSPQDGSTSCGTPAGQ